MSSYAKSLWRAIALVVVSVLSAGAPAHAAIPSGSAPSGGWNAAAGTAILNRAGLTSDAATAAGRTPQATAQRESGDWVFGTAILTAPAKAGEYPAGWLFLAHRDGGTWQVALDGSAAFTTLASAAPETILSPAERDMFHASLTDANSTNNTNLRLPWAIGQSWNLTGGAHGWSGSDRPFSSIDLSGGDTRVLAAGAGHIYVMCTSTIAGQFGGWLRIYHSSGYATDYYHLWNVITPAAGSSISEGAFIGNTGTNTCAGGSANGRHVHFAIGIGTPAAGVTRVAWNWRSVGKWVIWEGASPYEGFALHGSTQVNVGSALYNYGALGLDQGIVDAYDSASVNKRSGPGTGYSIVGSAPDGTTITISCWRNGTTHTGRYGTTAVWDKLSDGTWVSDAFVYTGTNTIGPSC
jgi:LasA protease